MSWSQSTSSSSTDTKLETGGGPARTSTTSQSSSSSSAVAVDFSGIALLLVGAAAAVGYYLVRRRRGAQRKAAPPADRGADLEDLERLLRSPRDEEPHRDGPPAPRPDIGDGSRLHELGHLSRLEAGALGGGAAGAVSPGVRLPIDPAMVIPARSIRYDTRDKLGQPGGFGTVYRGVLFDEQHPNGRPVAVKVLNDGSAIDAYREFDSWTRLGHDNVLPLIGICEDPPMLVSEIAEHGNLGDFVRHANPPPDAVTGLLAGVAGGMEYLHRRNVLHRDLKPDNVLVT
ncbi:kinase-like domain-containing protein [Hyaloraphidium curvatum]|nr:kinase-like domain-containing protein [Hyaloraphidium curvatum]